MSENTPDTILGSSAIDADDNEPSMEDILASIRQIIAEDKVEDLLALTDDEIVLDAQPERPQERPQERPPERPIETLGQEDHEDVKLTTQEDTQSELIHEVPIASSVEPVEPQQSEVVEDGRLDIISFGDENTVVENTNDAQENETKDVSIGLVESLDLNVEPIDTVVSSGAIVSEDNAKSVPDEVIDEVDGAFDDEFADLTALVEVAPQKPVDTSVVLDSALMAILPDVEVMDDLGDLAEDDTLTIPKISDDTLTIPKISDDTQYTEPSTDTLKPSENPQSISDDVKDVSIFFEDLDDDNEQGFGVAPETTGTTENIGAIAEINAEKTQVENDAGNGDREDTLSATPDEDIKLVKSLLADLMDDPEVENDEDIDFMQEGPTGEDSQQKNSGAGFLAPNEIGDLGADFFDDAVAVTDTAVESSVKSDAPAEENDATEKNMLDDILETVIKDEVAVHKEMSALLPQGDIAVESIETPITVSAEVSEGEVSMPDEGVFTDFSANEDEDIFFEELIGNKEDTKTLLDVVTETKSGTISESDIENDDDIVVLPNVDLMSKMALMAKTGAALAVAGAGVAVVKTAVKPELPEPAEPQNEPLVVAQEQIQEEIEQEITTINAENELKEQINMAQSAKTESILDAGEHRAGVDAFASLSAAVKEKEIEETRGPAIGDLVQDALKPMLKEWLDANLKKIVEKAVTAEVKRISSGK
ncbi:MAG: hypothetical protein COA43_10835 [Robiginitomaculum sp.]|nr:MAG: hypothetical protein COA43_10835 [Robiginitomaculum sp.]